ncbi:sensor histidine kinase [Puerhibacterium puerhi]|uniref:sensor histidine kinase n=1 Tax=Puerhibacterium puerhi TaxID=2692623 RepID=UPI001F22AA23|nr:HAMP domain-containing sensor histidine kinase [Puerhibacterium puerhi]
MTSRPHPHEPGAASDAVAFPLRDDGRGAAAGRTLTGAAGHPAPPGAATSPDAAPGGAPFPSGGGPSAGGAGHDDGGAGHDDGAHRGQGGGHLGDAWRHRLQPLWASLESVPLRARLVSIIVVLLALGLGMTAFVTRVVVSEYLVGEVDTQLTQSVQSAVRQAYAQSEGRQNLLPSDYVVLIRDLDGDGQPLAWPATVERFGTPRFPDETLARVSARGLDAFTVQSSGGSDPTAWRVIGTPVTLNGQTVGTAYVALPLSEIGHTIQFLTRALAISGVSIVTIGGIAAWLLVHRSLRPLRRIESTAAAIAAGDLSQRVPERPASTEVGSLSISLNTMLAQIERAFSAQEASEKRMRQFVSDASHELRTPLATIRGYGELYRMGALDTGDKVQDTMGRIEDSARRMGSLVNDLLELARMDEGRPLRREPVDLARLAHDAAQDLHALDPTRAVAVTALDGAAAPPSALAVTGDGDKLRQVLTNLVGNAARHTPAGTPVELALGVLPDGAARLEVRDHGPGVTPEQAARIFERFYRADSSRNRESGGSGLGMAIVAAIVGAHQGHVETATTPGGGLTVRVTLPAGDRPVESHGTGHAGGTAGGAAAASPGIAE